MNKLRVGIDVDGVLRGFVEKIVELSEKELGYKPNFKLSDYEFLRSTYVGGETIAHKLWVSGEWTQHVMLLAPVLPNAKKGYDMIVNDPFFDAYIVSAQPKSTMQMTDEWLEHNGFINHNKNYYVFDKTQSPCQVLIDDKIENIYEFEAKKRLGILIDQPWNRHVEHPYRAKDLIHAYQLIRNYYEAQAV